MPDVVLDELRQVESHSRGANRSGFERPDSRKRAAANCPRSTRVPPTRRRSTPPCRVPRPTPLHARSPTPAGDLSTAERCRLPIDHVGGDPGQRQQRKRRRRRAAAATNAGGVAIATRRSHRSRAENETDCGRACGSSPWSADAAAVGRRVPRYPRQPLTDGRPRARQTESRAPSSVAGDDIR